jgi:putative tryptophan/tyrosine transport system substrate-binding protein
MRRRQFLQVIGRAAAAWPLGARAQQLAKVARVGSLRQAGPDAKQFDAFRDGLRAARRNVLIEQRYAAGVYERPSGLAAELVRSNVDVIVVDGPAAAKACPRIKCTRQSPTAKPARGLISSPVFGSDRSRSRTAAR